MKSNYEPNQEESFIERLTEVVLKNLHNEQFSVSELAQQTGISRSHLHRKLSQVNGQSVSQFIREIRLAEAFKLLKEKDITAAEVAYKVGFNNPSYFNKCFHNHYGFTPGEVKKHRVISNADNKQIIRLNTSGNKSGKHLIIIAAGIILVLIIISAIFVTTIKGRENYPDKSIAVLPFENLSSDIENQYFANGLVEDLLNRLSTIKDLKVISRTSSEMFRNKGSKTISEISDILGVKYIVEGSIQRETDNIRVHVQMIDAQEDDHVFSRQFNMKLDEVFQVQSDIANQLISELSILLSDNKMDELKKIPTDNLEAFNYYTVGHLHYCNCTQEEARGSMKYFRAAIEIDSNFALAYEGLAQSYTILAAFNWTSNTKNARDSAVSNARKALELNNNLAEAHTTLGKVFWEIDCNIPEAEKEFRIAMELNPNHSETYKQYAAYLNFLRKYDEARIYINKAIALDPLNPLVRSVSTMLFMDAENAEYALKEAKICQELNYDNQTMDMRLFQIYVKLGDDQAAYETFRATEINAGNYSGKTIDSVFNAYGIKGLINLKLSCETIDIFKAYYYALSGEKDKALDWLEITFKHKSLGPGELHWVGHANKELLNEPRYITLLNKLGFKESYFY